MDQIKGIVEEFSKIEQVEAIVLGGSRGSNTAMADSDYDIYMYVTEEIDIATRKVILEKYCGYMELGNAFWELEDDCKLHSGTVIELIYRSLEHVDLELDSQAFGYRGRNGYTTCIWYNILNSMILFDRTGKYEKLMSKYTIPYPLQLSKHIITNNLRLLDGSIPSYSYQIQKACERKDIVSINHRITEFLASYFDIIWAYNLKQHPGEKRLIELCKKHCSKLPIRFEENLNLLLGDPKDCDNIVRIINDMVFNINTLVGEAIV